MAIFIHVIMATILTAYPTVGNETIQVIILTITIAPLFSYFIFHSVQNHLYATTSSWCGQQHGVRQKKNDKFSSLNTSLLSSSTMSMEHDEYKEAIELNDR